MIEIFKIWKINNFLKFGKSITSEEFVQLVSSQEFVKSITIEAMHSESNAKSVTSYFKAVTNRHV